MRCRLNVEVGSQSRNADDIAGKTAVACSVILFRKTYAHVNVDLVGLQKLRCLSGRAKPMRLLAAKRPYKDVELHRLVFPKQVEEIEGRHGMSPDAGCSTTSR